MEWNKVVSYVSYFMKIFNFIIIAFISIVIANTTYLISNSQEARRFLDHIPILPRNPIILVSTSISTYIMLFIVMEIKERIKEKSIRVIALISSIEVLLCIILMWNLNMNYNGIILVVIADLLIHIKNKNNKLIFLSFMIVIYILCDYDFASLKFKIISFPQYLTYYNTNIQKYILSLRSVFISINFMSFILYMTVSIRIQIDENNRIRILNYKLNQANDELKLMNIKLKDYAKTTEKMAETRERNRLAREIHDTIGHALTGIIAGIDASHAIIDYSPEEVKKQLIVIGDVARQGIKDVRSSVKALRPDALETLKLEEAIKRMIKEISNASRTNVIFKNNTEDLKFYSDEEDAIYRVIQEGITNAIRHGRAKEVCVTVSRKESYLVLEILDDGVGCKDIKKGFGLRHMKERVELLNGNVLYDGESGFKITANIPIRWGEKR